MKSMVELYKCVILTVIAGLLVAILLRLPSQPLTLGQMRAGRMNRVETMSRIPVVYVQDGTISLDNLDNPLPVEVENTVEAQIVK
jgi:hypothetical protein